MYVEVRAGHTPVPLALRSQCPLHCPLWSQATSHPQPPPLGSPALDVGLGEEPWDAISAASAPPRGAVSMCRIPENLAHAPWLLAAGSSCALTPAHTVPAPLTPSAQPRALSSTRPWLGPGPWGLVPPQDSGPSLVAWLSRDSPLVWPVLGPHKFKAGPLARPQTPPFHSSEAERPAPPG